jgi:transposase-like protein
MAQKLPRKYRKFSPEFRDEAVRLVMEHSRPIVQLARELGVNEGTLVAGLTSTAMSTPTKNHP